MTDLAEIMFAAAKIDQRTIDHLERFGVTGQQVGAVPASTGFPAIGIIDAEPIAGGLFAPGAGPRHFVQPVIVDGAVIDLVAWRSMRPDDTRLLRGVGWAMGLNQLEHGGWSERSSI